jgi:hypothetical protein
LFDCNPGIFGSEQALFAQSEKTFARIHCADRKALEERVRAGRLINAKLKYAPPPSVFSRDNVESSVSLNLF